MSKISATMTQNYDHVYMALDTRKNAHELLIPCLFNAHESFSIRSCYVGGPED